MDIVSQEHSDDMLALEIGVSNNIPECAFLKLSGKATQPPDFKIYTTINFDEYSPKVGPGYLRFSIRRADLRFRLTNCSMPYENRAILNELLPLVERQREITICKATKNEDETGIELGVSVSKSIQSGKMRLNKKRKTASEGNDTVKDGFKLFRGQMAAGGSEINPHWTFHVLEGDNRLIGGLTNKFWGAIVISNGSACIEARLVVRSRDVNVAGTQGLWPTNMTRNKTSIFRILALRHFKNKCNPWLSMAKISIGRIE